MTKSEIPKKDSPPSIMSASASRSFDPINIQISEVKRQMKTKKDSPPPFVHFDLFTFKLKTFTTESKKPVFYTPKKPKGQPPLGHVIFSLP